MYCYECSPSQLTGLNAFIFYIGTLSTGTIAGFILTSIFYGFSSNT